jgi:hypothetical protein
MDYAFAPGTTPFDNYMRQLLTNRATTTVLNTSTRIEGFLSDVTSAVPVANRPIGHLLIASHANDEGWMKILFDSTQTSLDTDYEELEAINTRGNVNIPAGLMDTATSILYIKGCRVGNNTAFMTLLKQTFGNNIRVNAPRHFHLAKEFTGVGVLECLAYSFQVNSKTRFTNKAAAVTAFTAKGFTLINSSAVPNTQWTGWIPTAVNTPRETLPAFTLSQPVDGSTSTTIKQQYRYANDTIGPFTISFPTGTTMPTTDTAKFAELQSMLNGDPRFASSHASPAYARYGYSSLADFLAGWSWTYSVSGRDLNITGNRHVYTLVIPITDPATGNLLFNFFPNAGVAHPVINLLPETDNRLFNTV